MAQQGKWGELLQAAQTAHKQSPNDARWQLLLGVAQAQTQQLGQARATFENMTKRYPELPEAHNNLGLVLAALGKSAEAKQAFEQALRANRRKLRVNNLLLLLLRGASIAFLAVALARPTLRGAGWL
ncbi:MAG: tetratricopeptide repeat protein, partial [Burkholderiaceae bacterium]